MSDAISFDLSGLGDPVAVQETRTDRPVRTVDVGRVLYLDIETIPDAARESVFALPPVESAMSETPESELLSPDEFLSQSLKECEEWLAQKCPPDQWLKSVEEAERQQKKPRSGLFKHLDSAKKAKQDSLSAANERIKLLSVTPEYCRICAIAWAIGQDAPVSRIAVDDGQELEALAEFWRLLSSMSAPIVTFNGLRFDIPVIFVRSALHGLSPTRKLSLKPWDNDVVDIYVRRFPPGSSGQMGQKALTRAYCLEDSSTQEDDGSQVYDQFQRQDYAAIKHHVESDIVRLRSLHHFMYGYFC